MKYWDFNSNDLIGDYADGFYLKNENGLNSWDEGYRTLKVTFTDNTKSAIQFREGCDNYFSIDLKTKDAIVALRELADELEKYNEGSQSV